MTRAGLFWRLLATYVVAGPMVAGWLVLGVMTIGFAASSTMPGHFAPHVFGMLSMVFRIFRGNYILSFVPALIGGPVLAVKDAYYGGTGFAFALATVCVVGLLVAVFCWAISAGATGLLLAAAYTLSLLVCWWLTRSMVAGSGFAT